MPGNAQIQAWLLKPQFPIFSLPCFVLFLPLEKVESSLIFPLPVFLKAPFFIFVSFIVSKCFFELGKNHAFATGASGRRRH